MTIKTEMFKNIKTLKLEVNNNVNPQRVSFKILGLFEEIEIDHSLVTEDLLGSLENISRSLESAIQIEFELIARLFIEESIKLIESSKETFEYYRKVINTDDLSNLQEGGGDKIFKDLEKEVINLFLIKILIEEFFEIKLVSGVVDSSRNILAAVEIINILIILHRIKRFASTPLLDFVKSLNKNTYAFLNKQLLNETKQVASVTLNGEILSLSQEEKASLATYNKIITHLKKEMDLT